MKCDLGYTRRLELIFMVVFLLFLLPPCWSYLDHCWLLARGGGLIDLVGFIKVFCLVLGEEKSKAAANRVCHHIVDT